MDEWEGKLARLSSEYGQQLSCRIKVAVLYSMMPRDMQEKIIDACSVAWDQTTEKDATALYERVKSQLRNQAKARRDMAGPKPMEVDWVMAEVGTDGWWPDGGAYGRWDQEQEHEDAQELQCVPCDDFAEHEYSVQMVGKGSGKKEV